MLNYLFEMTVVNGTCVLNILSMLTVSRAAFQNSENPNSENHCSTCPHFSGELGKVLLYCPSLRALGEVSQAKRADDWDIPHLLPLVLLEPSHEFNVPKEDLVGINFL